MKGNERTRQTLYRNLKLLRSLQTVTAAMKLKDACSLEEKLCKLSVLKSRDVTLLTKVSIVQAMFFPVVTYGYESWSIKKTELNTQVKTDAFKLWFWRRLLRVTWIARRSNQ